MTLTSIIGLLAGLMTTGAFLPQIIKTIKTKDTKSISLSMYVVYVVGVLFWFAYGIMLGEFAIILTNIFSLIFGMTMLIMKIFFK